MLIRDIIKIIEKTAPINLAYPWDNSGFLCGDINSDVKTVYITLDVNNYTVDEAIEKGAELIITHHPILFGGVKKIDYNTNEGRIISKLIKNNIAVYAAHTNMDTAINGLNDVLAEKLNIKDTKIIEKHIPNENAGLGRIGTVKQVTLKKFTKTVKKALNTPFVRVCGDLNTIIKTVAVGSGACDDIIPAAKEMGADVMVTADMKYHISIDSVEMGICVIDAGHYPTEIFVIDIFENLLKDTDLNLIKTTEKDVFTVV